MELDHKTSQPHLQKCWNLLQPWKTAASDSSMVIGSIGPEFFDPLPEDEFRLWNGEGD